MTETVVICKKKIQIFSIFQLALFTTSTTTTTTTTTTKPFVPSELG